MTPHPYFLLIKKMKEYGSIIGEGPDNDSGDKGW